MKGLQIAVGYRNIRTTIRDKKDCKQGQRKGFQIEAKRLQIGVEITNWGKRDYKPEQIFQTGAAITNWCRTNVFEWQMVLLHYV